MYPFCVLKINLLVFSVYENLNFIADVFNKHKAKYKAFNFDPKEDSEKIAEKLWNVTEKLAKEE